MGAIQSVLAALRASRPCHLTGLTPSSEAYLIAEWICAGDPPGVVLCPTQERAEQLASDLREFLARRAINAGPVLLPTWEHSPYLPIAPSPRVRFDRLRCIAALAREPAGPLGPVITTPAALFQATLPPEVFRRHLISFQRGASIGDRETLIRRLIESGHARADPVEDPGTFAVRGELLDIFPVDRDLPIRIELFGEEIEKIRPFGPADQRTIDPPGGSLDSVLIPPAREALLNESTEPLLRQRIKAHSDDAGIHRARRDPVLEAIRHGIYPEGCDAWAPFAYERPGTVWDYLVGSRPSVAWIDESGSEEEWEKFREQQATLESRAPKEELIRPPFAQLFHFDLEAENAVRDACRAFIDRFEAARSGLEPRAMGAIPLVLPKDSAHRTLERFEARVRAWLAAGTQVIIFSPTQSQLDRIRFLLAERGLELKDVEFRLGAISEGFEWEAEGVAAVNDSDVLGAARKPPSRRREAGTEWSGLQDLSALRSGDLVVHVEHGIGRYERMVRLDILGAPSDFIQLEYAGKDRLYLPVYRLNQIQKHSGGGDGLSLDRLGGAQFEKAKERAKESARKLAIDLVKLYAERQVRKGVRFGPPDAEFEEFCATFPFDETPDQSRAIDDVLADLAGGKVMDRLICGDVGFGKTEVAVRAAYRAVQEGHQVAVLVPTTVLAFQHEATFRARFEGLPVSVESLTRFKSVKEQKEIVAAVAKGAADIIIGTHRLLSKDISFKNLGLLVIDEEHRFGVEHKEILKSIRTDTHVLTLSATPIPRTLHMALSGIRDVSLIRTAPVDRLPVRTYVAKKADDIIRQALQAELGRGGQAFYLHNRVEDLDRVASELRELVPYASIGIAHAQMADSVLEKAMLDFYGKRTNVLVCTTLIESGLDIPSANTLIVDRADILGLSQLYQIRGRVGRSQVRAYAYFMVPDQGRLSEDASRRLEVIQRFVDLGSGFHVASHDLDLRGGGDLLGARQTGHIAAIGFETYLELLQSAVHEVRGEAAAARPAARDPEIRCQFPAFLPDGYVTDSNQRLVLYRRLAASTTPDELSQVEAEIIDRFGPPPPEAKNLVWVIRFKQLLRDRGVESLTLGPGKVSLTGGAGSSIDPLKTIALIAAEPGRYQLIPDSRLVAAMDTTDISNTYFGIERLLDRIRVSES